MIWPLRTCKKYLRLLFSAGHHGAASAKTKNGCIFNLNFVNYLYKIHTIVLLVKNSLHIHLWSGLSDTNWLS